MEVEKVIVVEAVEVLEVVEAAKAIAETQVETWISTSIFQTEQFSNEQIAWSQTRYTKQRPAPGHPFGNSRSLRAVIVMIH